MLVAVCLDCTNAATHLRLCPAGKTPPEVPENATEGAKRLHQLAVEAHGGPVEWVKPQHLFSSDETTQYL